MSDYVLDFTQTGSDGSATFSSSTGGPDINVSVSTPNNGDGDNFRYQNGTLKSSDVEDPTSAVFNFGAPVENVTFEIFDVDAGSGWDDKVTIVARDASGNIVPVNFSDLIAHHQVNGNSVEGGGNDNPGVDGSGAPDTVTVTIPGPIVSLEIIHDNGDSDDDSGTVKIADISFDAAAAEADGIVEGTDGDDIIDFAYTGDPEGDMVDDGIPSVPGEPGNDDIIVAGAGDDLVLAGDGDDTIYGEAGDDTLCGQDGDDEIFGGCGDDVLEGGKGDDTMHGGDGADTIYGNAGDDVAFGDGGADTIYGGSGNDELHGGGTTGPVTRTIDFNALAAGDIVDNQFVADGVTISSLTAGHPPMIFDSANPTGGDWDLATTNLGNVLILSEDGDSSDPDDNAGYGTLNFAFECESMVDELTFIDNEEGAYIRLYDENDNLIVEQYVSPTGNNSQYTQAIGVAGVLRMEVILCGSMAVDNLVFTNGEDDAGDYIDGGSGHDEIYGDAGDDTLIGGTGNDTIDGGTGDDNIDAGDGCDVVYGGDGDDVIDTSGSNPASDYGYPPLGILPDSDIYDDRDIVDGGAGDDTITTGDDQDIITGGAGNDNIDGGLDDDTIDGGTGNDFIIGGHGSDQIDGGDGNDTIWGGLGPGTDPLNVPDVDIPGDIYPFADPVPNNGIDVIHGGDGNDTIYGQDDADELYGDAGNDYIDGGIDDDTIDGGDGDDRLIGGQGNDTITGGAGADTMSGGDDRDIFNGITDDDTNIDGGSGGDDWDILDLSGSVPPGGSYVLTQTGPDSNGNGFNGFVTYYDNLGNVTGVVNFEEIEEVIPCFTPGSLIATPKGERLVEELREGDKIITRDNGIQEIRWIGEKALDWKQLRTSPHLKPILIQAGALGNGLPERDMLVSPNHRMLVANDRTSLYFDEREVLASAKHLVNNRGIHEVDSMGTRYIHFMFDRHEVVLSNGAWTESFQPGDYTLKGIGNAQRTEILELFPELETTEGVEGYQAARRTLKKHEARLIAD